MKNPLRARPWLPLVALVAVFLGVLVGFIVVAQRHPPRFIDVPRPVAKP